MGYSIINMVKDWYNEHGLVVFTIISIIFILLLACYNFYKGKNGKYKNYKKINKGNDDFEYSFNKSDMHTSKLELQSKFILEGIFKKPFTKIRPDFLYNQVTGKNLELDLYNNELKLAFEIDGNQHSKFTPFFHKSKEVFYNQVYRDEIKKMKCKEKGITLINIPYSVGEKGLKSCILKELRLHGYLI